MDPRTDLLIAEQRRADFERRAVEYRYARSTRGRRSRPSLPVRRNTTAHHTVGAAPVACCPA